MDLGTADPAEVAPRRHRSLLLTATQAGVGIGYGLANLFAATFAAPSAGGWRWAYWASFLFAALTYVVRTRVEESPLWSRAVEHGDDRRKLLTSRRMYVSLVLLAVVPLPMPLVGVETKGKQLDFQESEAAIRPAA